VSARVGIEMNIDGLLITDNGLRNIIEIEPDSVFYQSKIIINGNDNTIKLGSANEYRLLVINLKGNEKTVEIKKSIKNIHSLKFTSTRGDQQSISIGENFSCGGIEIQMNDGYERCTIGDNCLFSSGIKLRTSDGHSVVDLATGRATNTPKNVVIGNRVWVSEDVYFNKGSIVSDDSVVAAKAVVTKCFDKSNVIIAGFPAKVIKENIKWDRRMPSEFNRATKDNSELGKNAFLEHIKNNNYVQAYEEWLHDVTSVPYKIICAHLHNIEHEKVFRAVLKELAKEKFDFINSTRLCDYVYVLFRTNRMKYEFYRSELALIDELDYFTKAAFGLCEYLDNDFAVRLIKTNDKRLILRVLSLLPIHENNIKSLIEYNLLDKITHPILKRAYHDILIDHPIQNIGLSNRINKKLKIAVCISGQLRGYKKALATWNKFGFNDHDVDTYVCVWKDIGRKKLHAGHLDRLVTPNVAQVFKDYVSNYGLPKFELIFPSFVEYINRVNPVIPSDIEKFYGSKNVNVVDDEKYTHFSNMEKMNMMINKCWDMIPSPKIYDVVIRIRPDKILNAFNFNFNDFNLNNFSNVIIADSGPHIHTDNIYMGDQFAMGNPQVMKVYSELYNKYLNKTDPLFSIDGFDNLNPHGTLYANMLLNDIKVHNAKKEIRFGGFFEAEPIDTDTLEGLIDKDILKESELYFNLHEAIKLDRQLMLKQ
jgi:acetyltransferase-like isoleucine patch superfamily enzyme